MKRTKTLTDVIASQMFAIPTLTGLLFLNVQDIVYCKAMDNYTELFLTEGRKVVMAQTLKYSEKVFEAFDFIRIHRTYLVHVIHASEYIRGEGDGGVLIMDGKHKIPMARTRKIDFMNHLRQRKILFEMHQV